MNEEILIIDDNEQDAKVMRHCLAKAGYNDILWTTEGKKGIAVAQKQKPDIVIIDTVLPDMDGFRICAELCPLKKSGTKLIITTGVLRKANALKARDAGADDFVLKEPDCYYLLKAVKEALEQTQRVKMFETVINALNSEEIKKGSNKQAIKTQYPGSLELDDGSLLYLSLTTEQNLYVRLYFKDDMLTDWKQDDHIP